MVYIILVNWNGWRDTIECLESVLRLRYDQFRVLVCDNGSSDGSLDRIADWAQGSLHAECMNPQLHYLTSPPLPKPIPFLRVEPGSSIDLREHPEQLILVQTGANLGFAGGNNVGLRLSLSAGDLEYAWLLNNDTVVDPDALSHMIERMRARPDAGMCGSTLLYYHQPATVQALGGARYNRWLARVGHIGTGTTWTGIADPTSVEAQMNYVVGASMLVSGDFLRRVGLMDERYFLYFEEIDWATCAHGLFTLAYSPQSLVYHKEGATIGTSGLLNTERSELCESLASQNRILVTRRFFKICLPSVLLAMMASALHRLFTGRSRHFLLLIDGMGRGLFFKK